MNLYDKKMIKCTECGKTVGEIDIKVKVKVVVCDTCQNKKDPSYTFLNKRMIETVSS